MRRMKQARDAWSGGLTFTTGCVQSLDVGTRALVRYPADDVLYKATGRE